MEFKISREFLSEIEQLISENKSQELLLLLEDIHFADIAEIMEELDDYGAGYIFNTLDPSKSLNFNEHSPFLTYSKLVKIVVDVNPVGISNNP